LRAENSGLTSFLIHPDYVVADQSMSVYKALLAHRSDLRREKNVWIARPGVRIPVKWATHSGGRGPGEKSQPQG